MRTAYEIVKAHYDASSRGDLDGMLADLAPDGEWIEMDGSLCAGTHVGPAAVVENVFKVIGSTFEGFEFRLDRLLDAGDEVVAIGGYRGKHRRSGKPFSVHRPSVDGQGRQGAPFRAVHQHQASGRRRGLRPCIPAAVPVRAPRRGRSIAAVPARVARRHAVALAEGPREMRGR